MPLGPLFILQRTTGRGVLSAIVGLNNAFPATFPTKVAKLARIDDNIVILTQAIGRIAPYHTAFWADIQGALLKKATIRAGQGHLYLRFCIRNQTCNFYGVGAENPQCLHWCSARIHPVSPYICGRAGAHLHQRHCAPVSGAAL